MGYNEISLSDLLADTNKVAEQLEKDAEKICMLKRVNGKIVENTSKKLENVESRIFSLKSKI